ALAAAASVGWQALLVICCGLVVSAAYSLPPTRICGRGAVAALVLPACFVAVPYLLAVFAATGGLSAGDLVLLLGLYVGFIGRILLKDFRDVRGDALFGKRTFLVRHGRSATCRTSAVLWVAGSLVILLGVQSPTRTLAGTLLVCLAVSLWLLRVLAVDQGPRRDEAVISAIAVVGRGMMLIVLAHLGMTNASWSATASAAVLIVLTAITMGQAREMFRNGPRKAEVEIPGSVSLAGPQERSPTATTP
ncbi:MAG: UbiA family prenyltransferase, partial [Actinomycetes bacterium]